MSLRITRHLIIFSVVTLVLSCQSEDSGSGNPVANEDTQSGTTGDGATGNDTSVEPEVEAPPACEAKAAGSVASKSADLIFHGAPMQASVDALAGDGCLVGVTLSVALEESCSLSLALAAVDGGWKLQSGSFQGDAACGEFWPAEDYGTFELVPGASYGGVLETLSAPANETCLEGSVALTGRARFTDGSRLLDLELDGLSVTGGMTVNTVETGACPAASTSFCPPAGPYGTEQGEIMEDLAVYDCDGNKVYLHELCGANAGLVNLFASW